MCVCVCVFEGGRGGGGGVGGEYSPKFYSVRLSAMRSNPLPLYITFLTEKVSLLLTNGAPFLYLAGLEHLTSLFNCFFGDLCFSARHSFRI